MGRTTDGYYYPHQVRPDIARAVWAAVTHDPQSTIAALVQATGHCTATVGAALHQLRAIGYIDFVSGRLGTRTILVPFVIVRTP